MRNSLGQFKKNYTSWNKGIKGIHLSPKSEFKTGHKWPKETEEKRLKKSMAKLTIKPNLSSTNEMAHLLGLMKGDGFVSKNRRSNACIVCFDNTSKKLANVSLTLFRFIGLNPRMYVVQPYNGISKKERYRVLCYSKLFFEFFNNLNVKALKTMLNTKKKKMLFIRGFYEAEGTSIIDKKNRRYVYIVNTNLELIKLIKDYLRQLDFDFNLTGPKESKGLGKKPYYVLGTGRKEQVIRFFEVINPCIKRLKHEVK